MKSGLLRSRIAIILSVVFIITIVAASGPLSPISTQREEPTESGDFGNGSANITIIKPPPRSLTLEHGKFGSTQYILYVPEIKLSVWAVSGRPLLTYKVQLTELGYAQSTIAELSPKSEGRLTLSPKPISINSERVQNDTYTAELSIVLRASGKRTLYRENVTVHVER